MRPTPRPAALCAAATAAVLLLTACGGDGGGDDTVPPAVPDGVTAQASSSTSVHVMWNRADESSGVVGYSVYRDGAKAKDVPVAQHMVDITGLKPSADYDFAVRARDGDGNVSPLSASTPVTTLPAVADDDKAPTRPTKPKGQAAGARAATLTWGSSKDNVKVTSYDIYQRGTKIHSVGGDETSATVTTLRPGTAYTFTVKARDAADNVSPASPAVRVTTPSAPGGDQAAVPTGLRVKTHKAEGRYHLDLSWVAPATDGAVTEYEVHVDGKFSTSLTLGGSAPKDTAAISVPVGEKPGTRYTVKVRAKMPDGNWGGFSKELSVTTGAAAAD